MTMGKRSPIVGCRHIGHRGVAAVEFALVAPLMFMLAFGVYDLVAGTTTWWHLTQAAQAVGQIATSTAAQPNNTNSLTVAQAYTASTAAYPLLPQLASTSAHNFGVVMTSVIFTACTSGCTTPYTAAVAWSKATIGTGGTIRPCGPLVATGTDASVQSFGTLPPDAFTSSPLLVVDVTYRFVPIFTQFITGPILMTRSAYMPLRTGADAQWVSYVDPTTSQPMCPGLPATPGG